MSSELPPPPWSSLRDRAPARKAPLTREAITDAALKLVDSEGLDGLSMRRLAQELDTGAASLYQHVSGKDELLNLLIDRVASELDVPAPDPDRWTEQIKDYARGMHRIFTTHKDLAAASLANIPTGPNALRASDGLIGILRAGGLPKQAVAYAADLLFQYVTVAAYEASLFEERMATQPRYFEELGSYFRSLPPERFPNIAAVVDEMLADDEEPDERFEFALDLLVNGFERLAH